MPCKRFLGKQKGQVLAVWFGYAKAHQSLPVECGMACHAGGACLHVSEGVPPRRAVLSCLVALTFCSGLCFCVSVAVQLLPLTYPLQKQPGPYSARLLSPEAAKFILSIQLNQLVRKIQQMRELALQSTLQSMLLNGVTSAKGIVPVISTFVFY